MVEKSEKILIKIKLTPEELKTLENEREEARKNGERFSMRAVLERRFEKGLEEMEKIIESLKKKKIETAGGKKEKHTSRPNKPTGVKKKNGAANRRTGKK